MLRPRCCGRSGSFPLLVNRARSAQDNLANNHTVPIAHIVHGRGFFWPDSRPGNGATLRIEDRRAFVVIVPNRSGVRLGLERDEIRARRISGDCALAAHSGGFGRSRPGDWVSGCRRDRPILRNSGSDGDGKNCRPHFN